MPSTAVRQQVIAKAGKIVVKIGTNVLADDRGRLDREVVERLAAQIASAMRAGRAVTLVASGAIGSGLAELDLPSRPKEISRLQAVAAVGQGQLMRTFHDVFAGHGVKVAQVLVTREDFEHRRRYLNIRKTLTALGAMGVLPIINENDAVAVDEIRFGDNDIIAALVANMLRADLLVLLSVVDGVMKDGRVLELIEAVDETTVALAGSQRSRLGSGGMASKISAAGMVTKAGEAAVIANGRQPGILDKLLSGEKTGTVFLPARRRMSSRLRWIGQASRTSGKIFIDDGAVRAVTQRGTSLLPSGVTAIAGRFGRGATVSVVDSSGKEVARGISNYSSDELEKIRGLKTAQIASALGKKPYDEVIHRNNMTLR